MELKYKHDQLLEALSDPDLAASNPFEGEVTIRPPSYPERMRLPIELRIGDTISATGDDLSAADKMDKYAKNIEFMANAADKIKTYIVSCDLKHRETGDELKTVDDLYGHPETDTLMSGIVMRFVSGFVTKKKAPSPKPK